MSDLSVTERRLRPITDAIASRNWKQALQQCDKWQKKGEKSDRFLALKASILINQPDKSQYERGKAETLQLCHRNPVVTDIEALYQLQESLKHLSLHREEGPKLWERAISARPDDKELLTTLLNGSVSDGNWMSAQKAAMALRKAFPKERQYEFWNVLLCYLINRDTTLPQKDRDLFGRLAYMLISKAAESVPADKAEILTSGKEISTPEELSLLVKIFITTEHADEAVKLLQGDTLGLKSRFTELDPQFTFSLLLDALKGAKDQNEVFKICKELVLSGSAVSKQHEEDDRVWEIIQGVGKGAGASKDQLEACQDLAKSVLQTKPKCRAAYLALFELMTGPLAPSSGTDHTLLTSVCVQYFEHFGRKPFCFGDLAVPLRSHEQVMRGFCSKVVADKGDELQQAFDLKLKHVCLSPSDADADASYLKLAARALHLHKQLPKEKAECPEMMLLAATCLLRLGMKTQNSVYALQANCILHTCYSQFAEYYPTAIRQVQLYLIQGQISLAMEKFANLAIKNMQWETVGHLLLTRISTKHPWQTGAFADSRSPLTALDGSLTMLENADRSLDRAIHDGMKYGSYSNIVDSVDVKSKMNRSMNRHILVVEERRVQRLVGIPLDIPLDPYPADMVDQRDYTFLPDLGAFEELHEFETFLRCGPIPKKLWLIGMALHDHLATYLKAELASQTALAGLALDRLNAVFEDIKHQDHEWDQEMTMEESSSLAADKILAEALQLSKEPPATKQGDFDGCIDKISSTLENLHSLPSASITTVNNIQTPTWAYYHAAFTRLEMLQTISLFLSLQTRRTKTSKAGKAVIVTKEKLAVLQQKVAEVEKSIHDQTLKLKDGINASGVLGRLVDAAMERADGEESAATDDHKALAKAISELTDEAALEEHCGKLKESWEDGLNGVLRVKVKVLK